MSHFHDADHGSVMVIGAGAFGLAAALELRQRGWSVQIVEPGPFPHPDAASNDVSKIVRMDYGVDEFYSALGEEAIEGWLRWNSEWGWTPFRQDGFLVLAPGPMQPGEFEHDSYVTAVRRGRRVERLDEPGVRKRFPNWRPEDYPDGYVNLDGGWAPSGAVIEAMLRLAEEAGVAFVLGRAVAIESTPGRGPTVRTEGGPALTADRVVVAAGSWSPTLLPELDGRVWASGQPVFHYRIENVASFQPPAFVPWAAGTSTTGWYGFPSLDDGTLKVSNHGPGRIIDPSGPREVSEAWEERFAEFVSTTLPAVGDAPIIRRRLCVYTDTFDSDFLIDAVPERPGVVVATGGSGHGFKFAPVLGPIIADAVEGRPNPANSRFGWRDPEGRRIEPARFGG